MADINLSIGGEGLDELRKEIQELNKQIQRLKKLDIVGDDDVVRAKKQNAELLKASNLLKRQELAAKTLEERQERINQKQKESRGIIGSLEAETRKWRSALKSAQTLAEKRNAEKQLERVNKQLREAKGNTAGWATALGSFQFKFNALGNIAANVTSKISQSIKRGMKDALKLVVDFDQAMADVRSVSGSTAEQMERLRASAMKLGGSTKFTAVEVAGLQKEYAKLGFTTEEILGLQEATLSLSAATGGDLSEASKLVGGAMRAFNMTIGDTNRIASALAVATSRSALAFEDYETVLSTLGPVANAYGFTLEDTLALMGQLKNANFDTSSAATATRNIFLNLADANGALAQALGGNVTNMEELVSGLVTLRERGVDLNETLQLTDKRSVAAFNTFLSGAENALVLRDAITDVSGEMETMVNIQMDTLEGKITELNSAWQGLTLTILAGEKGTTGVKNALETTTDAIIVASDAIDNSSGKWSNAAGKILRFVPVLGKVLKQYDVVSDVLDRRTEKIEEANSKDSDRITVLDGVTVTEKKVETQVKKTVKAYQDVIDILKEVEEEVLKREEEPDASFILPGPDVIKKTGDKGFAAFEENLERLRQARADEMNEQRQKEDKEREEQIRKDEAAEQKKRSIREETLAQVSSFTTSLSDLFQRQKENELSASGDNAEKRLAIEKEYAKKQQAIAVSQAIVNAAQGALKTYYQFGWPTALPFMIAGGAAAAIEIAAIKKQKFAKGGIVGGKPHSQGGTEIEAERGEYVINKKSTSKYRDLIEGINENDQLKILSALDKDRGRMTGKSDPYTKKLYELLRDKEDGYETPHFYVVRKGTTKTLLRK